MNTILGLIHLFMSIMPVPVPGIVKEARRFGGTPAPVQGENLHCVRCPDTS